MKNLGPVFEVLFTGAEPDIFPIDASKYQFAASMIKQVQMARSFARMVRRRARQIGTSGRRFCGRCAER